MDYTHEEQKIIDDFQRELDAIERTTPMTENYARITPRIIMREEAGVTFKFLLYHRESELWYAQAHESAFEHLRTAKIIRADERIWDVGCNSGYWTTWLAMSAPLGHVTSFDPFPWNTAATRTNAKINDLQNVTVHQVGLGYKDRQITVHPNTAEIYLTAVHGVKLSIKKVEHFLNSSTPTFVKIDVEGAEQELAETALLRHPAVRHIYIEMHPQIIAPLGGDPRRFLRKAHKFGFSIHPEAPEEEDIDPEFMIVKPTSYFLCRNSGTVQSAWRRACYVFGK